MNAIQGAMAIRRERQKRQQRRMSQIKRHQHSAENSQSGSMVSLYSQPHEMEQQTRGPKTETSLTAFHLGVVFILLGFLMVFSSMVPSHVVDADWSKLLGVGTTFILVGLMMVMVNRIISQREEEELARYVGNRLGRTRSGHALARDLEPGSFQHRHHHKRKTSRRQSLRGSKLQLHQQGSFRKKSTSASQQSFQNGQLPVVTITEVTNKDLSEQADLKDVTCKVENEVKAPLAEDECEMERLLSQEDCSESTTAAAVSSAVTSAVTNAATTVVQMEGDQVLTSIRKSSSKRKKKVKSVDPH